MPHNPRKRFGQNFLHDQNTIARIILAIDPQMTDHLLEIGPGQGALTFALLDSVAQFDAIEIDRDLYADLCAKTTQFSNCRLHLLDALKCQLHDYTQQPQQLRVVGNLPYNISTPLLFHLLPQLAWVRDMHFMLQKEVVLRMAAAANTPQYGRLSVMLQYYCQADYLFTVPPTAFQPQPRVDSAIVRLIPYHRPSLRATDEQLLAHLVRQAFNQRRKTIRNSLKGLVSMQQFEQSGIDPQWRAQQLTVANFVELANIVANDIQRA